MGRWLIPVFGFAAVYQLAGAQNGEQIYARAKCVQCHTVRGRGGAIGPDLNDIGDRKDAAYIRASLLDPEVSVPRDFLLVRITTKQGGKVTGVRLNEDAFSIQVRDLSNQFHSYWKSDLLELVKEAGKSPMPSYRSSLTPEELNDLVAWLTTLRGTS